jgi:hypothetical protein
MKYLILILGIYLIYRYYSAKNAGINRSEELDLQDPPNRKKQYEEDYIDYDEID